MNVAHTLCNSSLSCSSLQNLVKHLPEQEQLNALVKYKSEYANLSEPEQFGVVVIPCTNTHTICVAATVFPILNSFTINLPFSVVAQPVRSHQSLFV